MCGRYQLRSTPAEVGQLFGVAVRDNFPPRYNIAPTQPIAVIHNNDQRARDYTLMRWGFIPEWAKGDYLQKLGGRPLINARAETVAEKPTFRAAFKRRRCLIPANGFYEWKGEAGAKQPFHIERGALFGFAGVWETAIGSDGGETDTAAIVTTAAGPDIRSLHHREPVVIAPEHFEIWLNADERDTAMLADLLAAPPAGAWRAYPVGKAVGSPTNDRPELIAPLS